MTVNRRTFLETMAIGGALAIMPRTILAASPGDANPRRLIVVFMRGGVDGLNVVVPYAEKNYYKQRPTIAIGKPGTEGGAIDLDGRFGLHPALAPLLPFWKQNQLAFVHASGSHDPSRSHFDAQDNMESGTPGKHSTPDGWLNRLGGALPGVDQSQDTPVRIVSIGASPPRIATGPNNITTIPFGNAASQRSALDTPSIRNLFSSVYSSDPKMGPLLKNYLDVRGDVREAILAAEEHAKAANRDTPGFYSFGGDAVRLGTLMRRDPRVLIGFLPVSGWDTHSRQGGSSGELATGLGRLGSGLQNLVKALGPVYRDTTIVVLSEFGRSLTENGSLGTDHGHGNVMWLLGGNVGGGKVYGDWPGLDLGQLYERRDLAITTDFRSVLAEICQHHMAVTDSRLGDIFPNLPKSHTSFDLIKS